MIIILKKEIEKLSPAVNRTQTGKIMLCYIVEMFYSIFLCTCADVTDEILKNLMNLNKNTQAIQKDIKVVKHRTVQISHITIETNRPQPSSTKTDRLHHQSKMKRDACILYNRTEPSKPNMIKCMVLNEYFSSKDICLSHIVGLRSQHILPIIGLSRADLWNPRNGLLLWREIEDYFEQLEVVSVFIHTKLIFIINIDLLDGCNV